MNRYWKIIGFLCLIVVPSCIRRDAVESSQVQIDNGFIIAPSSHNRVTGVVAIYNELIGGLCTATIVSVDTIISAAHCTFDKTKDTKALNKATGEVTAKMCVMTKEYSKTCAEKIMVPLKYLENDGYDVAVLKFAGQPFRHIFLVSDDELSGSEVVMVGYSPFSGPNDPINGSKRWGRNNTQQTFINNQAMAIVTSNGGTSDTVSGNSGDSGGPMLQECQQVGVQSRGRLKKGANGGQKSVSSIHTNLTAPEISSFLKTAATALDAHICRKSNLDPNACPPSYIFNPVANPPAETDGPGFPCANTVGPSNDISVLVRKPESLVVAPGSYEIFFGSRVAGSKYGYCENIALDACLPSNSSFVSLKSEGLTNQGATIVKILDLKKPDPNTFWSFIVLGSDDKPVAKRSVKLITP